ncbi:hypothetical protein KKI23_02125 [Patescibacteria group bacterium]|nr:hypothetical protein [Patescibacteria group bacterium]
MLKQTSKNNKGLTVIEAIAAISILLICVLGLINIFPWSLQISKSAETKTIATNLAQEKIEEIISIDYTEIGVGVIESRHSLGTDSDDPFYKYERLTEATYVDGDLEDSVTDTGMKKIIVTVYWSTQLAGDETVQMAYLISQF